MSNTGCTIYDDAKTPEEWVDHFQRRGVHYTNRALRERARGLGQCHVFGRGGMLITPAQMDAILESYKCPSKPTKDRTPRSGGRKAASNAKVTRLPTTSGSALAHLQKQKHGS